jgi:hypothetical protein
MNWPNAQLVVNCGEALLTGAEGQMGHSWKAAAGVLACCAHASAAVVLVGPTTSNGSFESGTLAPWTAYGNGTAVVQTNATLATDGSKYVRLATDFPTIAASAGVQITIPNVASANGHYLTIEYDWYGALSPNATGLVPTIDPGPALSGGRLQDSTRGSWIHLAYQNMVINPSFLDKPVTFSIYGYTPRGGFFESQLDNITVTQSTTPEPAGVAALALGGAGWLASRRRR